MVPTSTKGKIAEGEKTEGVKEVIQTFRAILANLPGILSGVEIEREDTFAPIRSRATLHSGSPFKVLDLVGAKTMENNE